MTKGHTLEPPDVVQLPTVGRCVHFWEEGDEPGELVANAATVIGVEGPRVHLFVMFSHVVGAGGGSGNRVALYSATPRRGHWSWPKQSGGSHG